MKGSPKVWNLARDLNPSTPLDEWYQFVFFSGGYLFQRDWYYYQGNLEYLKNNKIILPVLLHHLATKIDDEGKEILDGNRFLDGLRVKTRQAIHAVFNR